MLRLFFLAITAVVIVSAGYLLLPRGGVRPGVNTDAPAAPASPPPAASATAPASGTPANPPAPGTFVVHDAPPPPAAAPSPAAAPDLDAVMQRLRAATPRQDTTVAAADSSATPQVITPNTPPAASPPAASAPPGSPPVIPATPVPATAAAPPVLAPPATRWTSVTGQGARWRMLPGAGGYVVQIDLGGGRVADIHVAPAFANLDPAGMNQRVDYLKQTILQNFPPETASYTFARDGSVTLDP